MNWSSEKVLITGGRFLGRAILLRLKEKGCEDIRIFCRTGHQEFDELNIDVMNGDIRDARAVMAACEGRTIIFHTAAKAGIWGRRGDFFSTNVRGTSNVVVSCRKHRVPILVYTSSPSVALPPGNVENADESIGYPTRYYADYPESKAEAEKLVLGSDGRDVATVALRPHLIWGPGDPHLLPRIVELARKGKLAQVGDGRNLIDMTFIENAAEAHVLAAENLRNSQKCRGKAYFISDGSPVNLWDWINTVLGRLEIPPVHKTVSYRKAYVAGSIFELAYSILKISGDPPMTRFVAGQLAHSHYFNIAAACGDLGYSPLISKDYAMDETIEWLKNFKVR